MRYTLLALIICLCGCAGGPTHSYYSPILTGGPKFKGPIRMALVEKVSTEKDKCLSEGYTLIGTSDYMGKYPEGVELRAQARRVHANYVIYSCERSKGQAQFRFNIGPIAPWAGDRLADQFDVRIVFLGK